MRRLARRERAALPPPNVRNVEVKLLFHLFFYRFAALQHLDFRDVNGALVGIEMSFHLYMVAFMALEHLGIFDGPGTSGPVRFVSLLSRQCTAVK